MWDPCNLIRFFNLDNSNSEGTYKNHLSRTQKGFPFSLSLIFGLSSYNWQLILPCNTQCYSFFRRNIFHFQFYFCDFLFLLFVLLRLDHLSLSRTQIPKMIGKSFVFTNVLDVQHSWNIGFTKVFEVQHSRNIGFTNAFDVKHSRNIGFTNVCGTQHARNIGFTNDFDVQHSRNIGFTNAFDVQLMARSIS